MTHAHNQSCSIITSRGCSVKRGIVIVHVNVCLFVYLSVCLFSKRVSGSSYTVENSSDAALIPTSPEMKPAVSAVGSATAVVLSQSSGIRAAIFCLRWLEYGRWCVQGI